MIKKLHKACWPPEYQNPPWGDAPSIYDHIKAHIDPARETGLAEGGDQLPDEPVCDTGKIRFVPGALDGVMGHHFSSKSDGHLADALCSGLKKATSDASEENITVLYDLMKNNGAFGVIDAVIKKIRGEAGIGTDKLRDISLWFATKAADREPVKFAMALLGMIHGYDDLEVFLTLGRHNEFTLYSAVAIVNNEAYGEKALYRLAKSVDGWGRIKTVERLADTADTADIAEPEIKDWLIRDGFKNTVMYEYLACICARAGELDKALAAAQIDDGLFDSACALVATLVSGERGPAERLEDYEHGCLVVQALLRHGEGRFGSAYHCLFLSNLKDRVEDYLSDERPIGQDWTRDDATEIVARLSALLSGQEWKAVIIEALEAGDRQAFWDASRVCEKFGVDPWPYFFGRTEKGEDYWWDLMRISDAGRIDRVLDLADKNIPLEEIATGASDALGFGPDFVHHSALGFIVQDLGRFPGKGWRFIKAGLQSPTIRNRNMALRALSSWSQDDWPAGAIDLLVTLGKSEPDAAVKARFAALLAGEPIS